MAATLAESIETHRVEVAVMRLSIARGIPLRGAFLALLLTRNEIGSIGRSIRRAAKGLADPLNPNTRGSPSKYCETSG